MTRHLTSQTAKTKNFRCWCLSHGILARYKEIGQLAVQMNQPDEKKLHITQGENQQVDELLQRLKVMNFVTVEL